MAVRSKIRDVKTVLGLERRVVLGKRTFFCFRLTYLFH
jgi:hypothetical protein